MSSAQTPAVAGFHATAPYRIRPGDTVDVKLPYHPEEDATVIVRPDGGIMLALTGDLTVAGLTAEELAAVIAERARETLVDPEVAVTVRPGGDLRVYVGGEVNRPGFVPYRENLTPIQAIFDRGGLKPTGNAKKIAWITGVTNDGHYQIRKFNLEAALSGSLKKAPLLSPNDVLYVPQTAVGRVNDFVELYIRGVLPTIPRGGFQIPIP